MPAPQGLAGQAPGPAWATPSVAARSTWSWFGTCGWEAWIMAGAVTPAGHRRGRQVTRHMSQVWRSCRPSPSGSDPLWCVTSGCPRVPGLGWGHWLWTSWLCPSRHVPHSCPWPLCSLAPKVPRDQCHPPLRHKSLGGQRPKGTAGELTGTSWTANSLPARSTWAHMLTHRHMSSQIDTGLDTQTQAHTCKSANTRACT